MRRLVALVAALIGSYLLTVGADPQSSAEAAFCALIAGTLLFLLILVFLQRSYSAGDRARVGTSTYGGHDRSARRWPTGHVRWAAFRTAKEAQTMVKRVAGCVPEAAWSKVSAGSAGAA
jgi:hypothetical protein